VAVNTGLIEGVADVLIDLGALRVLELDADEVLELEGEGVFVALPV